MPEPLSILVPCKNRSLIYEGGRALMLFPRMVNTLRRLALDIANVDSVEMVVADFGSNDWPLERWLPHYMHPFSVKIVQVGGPFSVGRAWNVAVKHARFDNFFFLDTDMLVSRHVVDRGMACLRDGKAYFPICWSWDKPDGDEGEWRIYGCGNVFMTREHWGRFGPRSEFKTHGKSDELLLKAFTGAGMAVRERAKGFFHQWHPNDLAWLNRHYERDHSEEYEASKMARTVTTFWDGLLQGGEHLFFGPYVGEFGHELMAAALLRKLAPVYKQVTICSRPGMEALYADFATTFIPHGIVCVGDCHHTTGRTQPSAIALKEHDPPGATILRTLDVMWGMGPKLIANQAVFVPYGKKQAQWEGAFVIHARSRGHVPSRNWSQANWNRLARRLRRKGLVQRIVCIGTKRDALLVEGACDMRGAPLREQMDVLASAKMAMGPSSGPMHLAQQCGKGCPVFIWCGGGKPERDGTARRYKKGWNPFRTRARAQIVPSWRPSFDEVWQWTTEFLEELG